MAAYDLIIYGATGFTGQLCVSYLSNYYSQPGSKLRWAVAGRSLSKLNEVVNKLGVQVDIIVADSFDERALVEMCQKTKVVISLVGPYMIYGALLVKACAENGVHYLDLTGETSFSAAMIKGHARSALSTRALILHSCGFDSIPGDLTTYLAVQSLKRKLGPNNSHKVGEVLSGYSAKGGASGGTLASGMNLLEAGTKEELEIARNGFALSPVPANHKIKPFLYKSVTYKGKTTSGSFFIMGPSNSAVVRRTWGILEGGDANTRVWAYGPHFQYEEFMQTPGPISAIVTSLVIYFGFGLLAFFAPARWALKRFGPKPGEGPSLNAQINGRFTVTTTAKSIDRMYEAQAKMIGKGDPGYFLTSKMIVESALCIIESYDQLPPLARMGGPLTPATAFGEVLIERLRRTEWFNFTVE